MPVFKTRGLVLFDFDGVLVDTMQINLDVNRKLFDRDFDIDEYRKLFLGNIYEMLDKDHKDLMDEEVQNRFAEAYGKLLMEMPPFNKVDEMLRMVAEPRRAHIVTSSREEMVSEYLDKHGLLQFFDGVHGKETHTSKVVKFQNILKHEDTMRDNSVFITDTVGDVLEADEVGIDSIAVTWGFHPEEWIKDSPHHTMVHSVDELRRLF